MSKYVDINIDSNQNDCEKYSRIVENIRKLDKDGKCIEEYTLERTKCVKWTDDFRYHRYRSNYASGRR